MSLNIGLYVIPEAQNLHAEVFFDFKASGDGSRVDYRGGIIKNHQKTMSKWRSTGAPWAAIYSLVRDAIGADLFLRRNGYIPGIISQIWALATRG